MGATRALMAASLFVLAFSPISIDAEDMLELTNATAAPGTGATLFALLTNDGAVQGFQVAITYESAILTLNGMDTAGLDVESAVNGDIEFFFTNVDANVAPGVGWGAAAAIFDTSPPFDGQTLPPGVQQSILACDFSTANDSGLLGSCAPVNLTDGYGPPPGINNIITVANTTVYPTTNGGQICFVGSQVFIRGDTNQDEVIDLADGIFLLQYLFVIGQVPECFDAGDANDDEILDISDFITLMTYQFLQGPPPSAPFPECGLDPSGTGLDCAAFPQCGTVAQAPEITGIVPPIGTPLGNDGVFVHGESFTTDTTVTFGTVPAASVTYITETTLLVITPQHPSAVVDVIVANSIGSSMLMSAFTFREPPVISGVDPDNGTATGGETVTISGDNFTPDAEVRFGEEPAQSVEYCSPTEIRVVTPEGSPGTEDVKVENDNGETVLPDGYRYLDPPAPASVAPAVGSIAGGDTVTITGQFFTSDCTVEFGGVAATSVTFVSDMELTVVTPAHPAGVVDVTVTNLNGPGTLAGGFTYE